MKPADLEETITKYNENCKKGVDPDFNRPAKPGCHREGALLRREAVPDHGTIPRAARRETPSARWWIPFDQPIPRLYTAGELGSFWGWMYNGGGNNAECLCTGQIAARNVTALKSLS
jgi:hypothetical protein